MPVSNNKSVCRNEKDVSLLKILLYCGIDFEKIRSLHFKHFFALFDPTYKVPNVNEFQDHILQTALDSLHKTNHSIKCSNVIGIVVHNDGEEVYAVSFLLNSTEKYI